MPKGRYIAASDVGLLVVYDGQKVEDDYVIVRKTIKLPNLQLRDSYYSECVSFGEE